MCGHKRQYTRRKRNSGEREPLAFSITRIRAGEVSMSPPKEQELEVIGPQVSIERRSRVRFPLELHVRYRTLGRGCSFTGAGLVVNMSSTGVLIASQHEIDAGTRLELNIEWPC